MECGSGFDLAEVKTSGVFNDKVDFRTVAGAHEVETIVLSARKAALGGFHHHHVLEDASDERDLLIREPIEQVILHYAETAKAAGLDGVVCSPLESGAVHDRCGADFLTVTPGVRFAGGEAGDQKRVTTPFRARQLGSDYIVVGRPITASEDPVQAYRRCVAEFTEE